MAQKLLETVDENSLHFNIMANKRDKDLSAKQKLPSPDDEGVVRLYKMLGRAMTVLALASFGVSYIASSDDSYQETQEFWDKVRELRHEFTAVCEESAHKNGQSVYECTQQRATQAAMHSNQGMTGPLALMLGILFTFQAAGLRTGQYMAQQRIKKFPEHKP